MAGGVSNSDLRDLLTLTLENLPDDDFEVVLKYRAYPVCNMIIPKYRRISDGGTSYVRFIQFEDSGAASQINPYERTPIAVKDVQNRIEAQWVQTQTNYSISRYELIRNMNRARIVELVRSKRVAAKIAAANLFEELAWNTKNEPTDSRNPDGFFAWINFVPAGQQSSGGFVGTTQYYQDGSSTTIVGGINKSNIAQARNWAATYSGEMNLETIKRMRLMQRNIGFSSPMSVEDLTDKESPYSAMRWYMGNTIIDEYEGLAASRGDTYGSDVEPFAGMTAFRRIPIVDTPILDSFTVKNGATTNTIKPIALLNHNYLYYVTEQGNWNVENEPITDREQHDVFTVFYDWSWTIFCENFKYAGGVIHEPLS